MFRDETASCNICRAAGDKTGAVGFVLRTVWQLSQVHMHMQTMPGEVLHPALSNVFVSYMPLFWQVTHAWCGGLFLLRAYILLIS